VALENHTAYCTSKGALDQLTRVMALELGVHKIRVNCVNPTGIEPGKEDGDREEWKEQDLG
jgi:NAD(P)-dependent dehydrogenase (short-subunit alcohol dehydrogenase family)